MSTTVTSNAISVSTELERIADDLYDELHHTVEEAAIDVREGWRDRARVTARKHGKRYPNSIDYQMGVFTGDISAEIWPQSGKQADMSFEYGSENQPAHMDGQQTFDEMKPLIERRLDIAIGRALR